MAQRGSTKSHRMGGGTLADGAPITVYRAAVALTCAQCQRPLDPGALFSRHAQQGHLGALGASLQTLPVCRTCRPFRFGDQAGDDDGAAPMSEDDHG